MNKKIVIIGAGPTGLGAAWRLSELKHQNWHLYERHAYPGGLASSFADKNGFTWDIGGHVLFSHYKYFDRLMDKLLGKSWYYHVRESWIWIFDRFVPYPFQYNIKHLPPDELWKCIKGLIDRQNSPPQKRPKNFAEWIYQGFGQGLAEIFMIPYNFKVWAHHPRLMHYKWIGERVATIDLDRLIKNITDDLDDISWGPNSTFRFPKNNGTGQIFSSLARRLNQEKISYQKDVGKIDVKKKTVYFTDNTSADYDALITTIPLDQLIAKSNLTSVKKLKEEFKHSSVHVVGAGILGQKPSHLKTKCWTYFPEDNCPFYRATVFSNYSKNNVANPEKHWSLMTETSQSNYKPVDYKKIATQSVQGLKNTKFIGKTDKIVDRFHHFEEYAYPTPFLKRDQIIKNVLPAYQKHDIYSRGRFGAWKYEVGNMDHSLMQGVEIANYLVKKEKETTLFHPETVNK